LLHSRNFVVVVSNVLAALQKLWKNDVPFKVNAFSWRLLLQKLLTRAALNHRGILLNLHDLPCIFCFLSGGDCSHLFFRCTFIKGIWKDVLKLVSPQYTDRFGWLKSFFFCLEIWLNQREVVGFDIWFGWRLFDAFGSIEIMSSSMEFYWMLHLYWII
jgi:hypothetical protein